MGTKPTRSRTARLLPRILKPPPDPAPSAGSGHGRRTQMQAITVKYAPDTPAVRAGARASDPSPDANSGHRSTAGSSVARTPRRSSAHAGRYALAAGAIAAVLGIKLALVPWVEHDTPFLLFFAAVLVAGWFGGL